MQVHGLICPSCGEFIYSCATHDFRYCGCGKLSIDGGQRYFKFGWDPSISKDDIKHVTIEVDATQSELYDDWNQSLRKKRKYGRILPKDLKKILLYNG